MVLTILEHLYSFKKNVPVGRAIAAFQACIQTQCSVEIGFNSLAAVYERLLHIPLTGEGAACRNEP
jgi:hypothetical protein